MNVELVSKYRTQYKYFDEAIGIIQAHLKSAESGESIYPNQISFISACHELDAIFILSLFEQEGLMKRCFRTYTEPGNFLGEFDNIKDIPKTGNYIEIIFKII